MSQTEHCRSDLRQPSPETADNQAHNGHSKVTQVVSESLSTNQMNCSPEEKHAMNTARENAIASLIVLANLVPVCLYLTTKPIIADNTRR